MLERAGFRGRLEVTHDLERVVDGADFVLVQIRVGGQEARLADETIPLACGCIGQETTGAGGFAKAMRTVPVVLEIAQTVREQATDGAWIIDFTNPVGIVTRALLDAGHRAVGLCNVAIGFQRRFAGIYGVEPERSSSIRSGSTTSPGCAVRLDGEDVLPELLTDHGDELAAENELPRQLLDELGVIPSYYLHYFYAHDAVLSDQLEGTPRAETVMEIERGLLELYRDPSLSEKPTSRAARRCLLQRGGDRACGVACGRVREVHVVDVRNDGTLGPRFGRRGRDARSRRELGRGAASAAAPRT